MGAASGVEAGVVLVEKDAGVATVTLNRPKSMNALSRELQSELLSAFHALAADRDVDVVILTGSGERAFCAGLDLKELGSGREPIDESGARVPADGANLVRTIEEFDRPVIGAINGVAITGGFELALACDVLVASTNARFADTHARVGIMPGWGLSQKLSRLLGIYRAKELSLTGNFLLAEQAEAWGLVNRVVPPDELLSTCRALAADMQSCDPEMVVAYKAVIDRGFAESYGEGRQIERSANREHGKQVRSDTIESRRGAIMERGRAQSKSPEGTP
jgi:enoyl-CoA hydratase